MRRLGIRAALMGGVVMIGGSLAALGADDEPKPPEGMKADPKVIWPAGLEKLAGRYVFLQVASPGGLWENSLTSRDIRQVSINEVPEAFRQKLTHAEIVISDLQLPTEVEGEERDSPSGRGKLRFYTESVIGKLTLRNLPGIGGEDQDKGEYSGPVVFQLDHQLHSNPSVFGVLQQRLQQEPTWGAATLDYADLSATSIPPEAPKGEKGDKEKPAPQSGKGAKESKPGKAKKPAAGDNGAKPEPHEDEGDLVIANARVLRSGIEIFAFVEWTEGRKKRYVGSVRLMRAESVQPPQPPAPRTQRNPRT